jgi:hypothetical protein
MVKGIATSSSLSALKAAEKTRVFKSFSDTDGARPATAKNKQL